MKEGYRRPDEDQAGKEWNGRKEEGQPKDEAAGRAEAVLILGGLSLLLW